MRGWPWTRKHGFYPPGWPIFLTVGLCVYVVTARGPLEMDAFVYGAATLLALGGIRGAMKKRERR